MKDAHSEVFKEEAYELLGELEEALLELEEQPTDTDLIGRVFRAMHTIKGSGAMFGFDEIATFTHEVETVFDAVREGRLEVTGELINLTLSARDLIREMLDASDGGEGVEKEKTEAVVAGLRRLLPTTSTSTSESQANDSGENRRDNETSAGGSADRSATYRVRFKPAKEIFAMGSNPLLLLDELRSLGECVVVAQTDQVPGLEEIDPEACYISWDIVLTTTRGENAIRDVFIFVEDDCELRIDLLDDPDIQEDEAYKRFGEILVERGDIAPDAVNEALNRQKRLGDILVEQGVVDKGKVEAALAEQEQVRKARQKRQATENASSIRVSAEKLDGLVNLVGELVIVQARLSQLAAGGDSPTLLALGEELEHLTAELRDSALGIRMLPIGTTFSKFKRLVRDLSGELGKEVDLTTDGAETELDKTVIERLNDPLVHIIRNSIDHGIEPPDVRTGAGKPRRGRVHLSASHSGANVVIRIVDDGAGMDADAIREKAVEKGLIPPDGDLSEKDLFGLIFAPGFSTAKTVTGVSGRGVGMDVVKRNIEALRGSIDVSSTRGQGSEITIKLPLTLAIIEGLQVAVGDDRFVLPLALVEECIELSRSDVARAHGRHMVNVRNELVPYIRLREWFGIHGTVPEIEQVVITESDGDRVGLVVDNVIGEHQTVIKNLGAMYRNVEGISGATIQGDGTVALILDVPRLIRGVEREQSRMTEA